MRPVVILVSLMLVLSAPVVAAPLGNSVPPAIDPHALAILQRSARVMLSLKTYQAECDTALSFPPSGDKPARERKQVSTLQAAKPNKMRYDMQVFNREATTDGWVQDPKEHGGITFICDGKTLWQRFGDTYEQTHTTGPQNLDTILEPWGGFYTTATSPSGLLGERQRQGELLELRRTGREAVAGVPCDKVFDHMKTKDSGSTMEWWETWYVSDDGLVRRHVERIGFSDRPGYTRDDVVRNIRLNGPIPGSQFVYKIPPGVEVEQQREPVLSPLLAVGTAAPEFTAKDKDGKTVRLSGFKGKVVVLDFWASWCPPCRASMPHNQKVMDKLKAEGLPVVLLAVDNSEEREAFTTWVGENGPILSALTFIHIPQNDDVSGTLYHVNGIPTQYVLDKAGVVRASFVGYGGPTGDLEVAIRAALKQP